MADPEHVEVVKRGAAAIAEWRQENPGVAFDLSGDDRSGVDLSGVDLTGADLSRADLTVADLSGADLSGADLSGADLTVAYLSGADLNGADLTVADLIATNLDEADLSGADLSWAKLGGPRLSGTNLTIARVSDATFSQCDLSQVAGLETVRHGAPSSIGTDTLLLTYQGAGNRLTPDLRGFFIKAGVPASLLDALPRIAGQVQYHSAFIAYGEPDRDFAERLHTDLTSKDVSCWTYAMDATPGKQTWREIGQKRREAGKFIVLCSVAGLAQAGPKKEIEDQMDDEPDRIIPVSLDDRWRAPAFEVRRAERDLKTVLLPLNYVDFSPKVDYDNALGRLLKALELRPDAPSP